MVIIGPKYRAVRVRACRIPKELQSQSVRGGSLRSRKAATLPVNSLGNLRIVCRVFSYECFPLQTEHSLGSYFKLWNDFCV
jgi:hypothetical protein